MSYSSLMPLLKKTGSSLTAEDFQARINVVFHDHEANHYDSMHQDMWESLQEQINLLVADWFAFKIPEHHLSLLDIGCGTGLSTQKLLQSPLGNHIDEVTLLDTSANMLRQAEEKAKTWGKSYTILNADIATVTNQFDVIIVCSVLHHIPELDAFLKHIDRVLKADGVLIHLQDPNGDYLNDASYKKRSDEYSRHTNSHSDKSWKAIIPKRWKHFINRNLGRKNYIDHINDQLLTEKVISKRMTADEIWTVTDIHVESKLSPENKGISFRVLKDGLSNFNIIRQRSYAFYGVLKSDLPAVLKSEEALLIEQNQLNGRNISCIWIKKN